MFLTKGNPLLDARLALDILKKSKQYCDDYIILRREYFNKWQKTVFPTSITIDFFENIVHYLSCGSYIEPRIIGLEKPYISEYERNFNAWLKIMRGVK